MREAVLALMVLGGCAADAPGGMCLINCTVVVRSDSAGDDDIRQERNRHIDHDTRERALKWLQRKGGTP